MTEDFRVPPPPDPPAEPPLVPEPPPEPPCALCGKPLRPEMKFCTACGHRVGAAVRPGTRRALFQKSLSADTSRIKSVVWFYLTMLTLALLVFAAVPNEVHADIIFTVLFAAITSAWLVAKHRDVAPFLEKIGLDPLAYVGVIAGCVVTFLIATVIAGTATRILDLEEHCYSAPFVAQGYSFMWVVALIAVAPGIFEEIAFRGVIQGELEHLMKRREALLVTAAVFAIIHLDIVMFPFLFALGIYLGWLRNVSGSLLPGMVAHFGHNLTVVLAEKAGFQLF